MSPPHSLTHSLTHTHTHTLSLSLSLSLSLKRKLLLLLRHFRRVRLCATPWMAAHQALPSMGFSTQEYWGGLPFPSPERTLRFLQNIYCSCGSKHCSHCVTEHKNTISVVQKARLSAPAPSPLLPHSPVNALLYTLASLLSPECLC